MLNKVIIVLKVFLMGMEILYIIYIDISKEDNTNDLRIGFLNNNYGTIKNLGISKCNVSISFTSNSNNTAIVGGLVGYNYGIIDNCFSNGQITANTIENGQVRCGGIYGHNRNIIRNCYNCASINTSGIYMNTSGGICGYSSTETAVLDNCYNNSTIITSQASMTSSLVIGEIIGQLANSGKATNCAYKTGTQNSGIGIKSDGCIDETVELDDLPDILSIIGNQFKDDDTNNINNGYPILTWQ